MPRFALSVTMALMAAISASVWTQGAHAFSNEPLDSHNRARLAQEGRFLELQVLENEQRRRQFQRQQQRHREQDRETLRYRPPKLQVPVMRRNCQAQPFGNNWLTSCR